MTCISWTTCLLHFVPISVCAFAEMQAQKSSCATLQHIYVDVLVVWHCIMYYEGATWTVFCKDFFLSSCLGFRCCFRTVLLCVVWMTCCVRYTDCMELSLSIGCDVMCWLRVSQGRHAHHHPAHRADRQPADSRARPPTH